MEFDNFKDVFSARKSSKGGRIPSTPKISKSSGMGNSTNFFYLPEKELLVTSNPIIYNVYRQILKCENFIIAPERGSIKAVNTTDMQKHLDTHLFYNVEESTAELKIFKNPVQPGDRLQGFVCLEIDEEIEPRDSGTLEVLECFHHYWSLAKYFFHPVDGFEECRLADEHKLPQFFTDNHFNATLFDEYIKYYTRIQNGDNSCPAEIVDNELHLKLFNHALEVYNKYRVEVPQVPFKLEWTPVKMTKGSLAVWDCCIPHRNLRNRSTKMIPRIVNYVDLRPINEHVYFTKQFQNRKDKILQNRGHSGKSSHKSNVEEVEMVNLFYRHNNYNKVFTEDGDYFHPRDNLLYKALLGFDPKTGETFTWTQYKQLKMNDLNKKESEMATNSSESSKQDIDDNENEDEEINGTTENKPTSSIKQPSDATGPVRRKKGSRLQQTYMTSAQK